MAITNITIANVLSYKSGRALGVKNLKKVTQAYTTNKVYYNKQTQTKQVISSEALCLDSRDRNSSPIINNT